MSWSQHGVVPFLQWSTESPHATDWPRGPEVLIPPWILTDGPRLGLVNVAINGVPELDQGIKPVEAIHCHIIKQSRMQLMASAGSIKPVEAINHALDCFLKQQSLKKPGEVINFQASKQSRHS